MRKPEEIQSAFSPRGALEGRTRFFLVGIGGAGMSALARMLKHRGYEVKGTDSTRSPETDRLQAEGISVRIGHSGDDIRAEEAVVLTDAVDITKSPEYRRAVELGCPVVRRSVCLGWLLKDKKVIAVTGTHGKTTTTGMVGAGLIAAGLDPFVMVGANIPQWGGPVVGGSGGWAVVEACEAYDSFHDLDPYIVVLTNLELDHVDFHGSYENLRRSVQRFVDRAPGGLVYCESDQGAQEVAAAFIGEKRPYSRQRFDLALPGEHNQTNAAGALAVAELIDADLAKVKEGVALFGGAERRLQVLLDGFVTVLDDYAHHPTEICAGIQALRERYPDRRLIVVYQPHLYSRTAPLIPEFAEALSGADLVVLTDIYPAREDPIPGVSSARIAELITKPVVYVPNRHLLPRKVAKLIEPGDVVVGMGAGNISEFAPALIQELGGRAVPSPPTPTPTTNHAGEGAQRIAVIYGGNSGEREVSILSGRAIHAALLRSGYQSVLMDVAELLARSGDLSPLTGPNRPDLAFLAVHGEFDEGGGTQGLFELLNIPYTGSGLLASAIAMDKELTKKILSEHGIRVPRGVLLRSHKDRIPIEPPLVVKPNKLGSTVGLRFVDSSSEIAEALEYAFSFDNEVLVEEFVTGVEISTPVLVDAALPPVEIAPLNGRYDFESKYTPGATEEIVPARLPEHVIQRAKEIALQAHRALRCDGATRTDAILRGEEIVVLEVNTLPGMTATSLLPKSAEAAGISFEQLCQRMVDDAMRRYAAKT